MKLKQIIGQVAPKFLKNYIRKHINKRDLKKFNSLSTIYCEKSNLLSIDRINLDQIFNSNLIDENWNDIKNSINNFDIVDGTGGVNKGDRRAIYYLINNLKPKSVLEIGTHIGASTVHIASSMLTNNKVKNEQLKFTTLDIRDVNSIVLKPWLQHGMSLSPREMIKKIGCDFFVTFKIGNSTEFLKKSSQKFDFIFLDGDHLAKTTYEEIPAALNLLKPNGVILLHDFFPNMEPLWSNGIVLKGTYLATKRLIDENDDLIVLPLGKLPWKTKLNSNVTSLALLLKK